MRLYDLKSLYDTKSTELEVLNYKHDDAIMVALQLFEEKLSGLKNNNHVHPI
ncbi:hypothetical protein [Neobacillus mesonae]|uniref:hypothetical protein n=1 Tax=Neobacillus mesonae TaxID=1193713 RepID=UPI001372C881|nr:hypothetical protein [Neobacillus mesonae]